MERQDVHLSVDKTTAFQVGSRKAKTPVILKIKATKAYASGVRFYEGNEMVWLSDHIPSDFIVQMTDEECQTILGTISTFTQA